MLFKFIITNLMLKFKNKSANYLHYYSIRLKIIVHPFLYLSK